MAVVVATLAAVIPWYVMTQTGGADSDFAQVWFAARALLSGDGDPYKLIQPGGEQFTMPFPFFYPMTAVILALPLGFLSAFTGILAFVWISTAILAFVVTRTDWRMLPIFLSAPFAIAALRGQWSILLTAGLVVPTLALFFSAKPNIGLALLVSNPSKRAMIFAVAGGVVLSLIGLLFVPEWPREWLQALRSSGHQVIPIAHPAGLIAAMALLRWRRSDARLIFALACVPQTMSWYEALPLQLVATTFRETLMLSLASCVPLMLEALFGRSDGSLDYYPSSVTALMVFAYVPPLIMVLRRPNVRLAAGVLSERR